MKRLLLALCLFLTFVAPSIGPAFALETDDSGQFTARIEGRKTWTIGYGFGSVLGLAAAGVSAGQVSLEQSLAVDISAEALSILRVEGHFDDQSSETDQSLSIYLDTESLDGVLGDFTIDGMAPFTSYRRSMTGLQLEYSAGDVLITGVMSRVEGTAEAQTFIGATAEAERTFSAYREDEPWVEQSYARNIDGLYAFSVDELIVEDFTEVALRIEPTVANSSLLQQYGLAFLDAESFEQSPRELTESNYAVIEPDGVGDERVLLLTSSIAAMLRNAVDAAIDAYNERTGESETYPLIQGSDYETEFLARLETYALVTVDDSEYALADAQQRTYYALGHDDVLTDTVEVEISLDSGSTYIATTHPDLPDYSYTVYAEAGIVAISFPAWFFDEPGARLRATFSYNLSSGAYSLGLSLIPESESVTLNGVHLERDVDYMIDYDVGLLILLIDVEDDDIVTIEYERYSGGFGGASEYARYFYGGKLDLPLSNELSLSAYVLAVVDDANSIDAADSATTMPNRQTIAGLSGSYADGEGFSADFAIGYNVDAYPFDANVRPNAANAVSTIAQTSDGSIVLIGHSAGFSARSDGEWRAYSTADGLPSNAVQALAVGDEAFYIGTGAGLAVVERAGDSPLDRAENWARLYEDDGLPDASIGALLVLDDQLWIGTAAGLAIAPVDSIYDIRSWAVYLAAGSETLPSVQALAADEEYVYVGTESGLYRFDLSERTLESVDALHGLSITALLVHDGMVYVASERGLRAMSNGMGAGWIVVGEAVTSLAVYGGELHYGTSSGVVRALDGNVTHSDWPVTALAGNVTTMWIGTQANADYVLVLWRRQNGADTEYDNDTARINGKNPSAYVDLTASDWSDGGFLATASFNKQGDGYSLSGKVEIAEPAYHAIGSTSSRDVVGWNTYGAFDVFEAWTLTVENDYEIAGRTTGKTSSENDTKATLTGTIGAEGPTVEFTVRRFGENVDATVVGSEVLTFSYSAQVRETLFDDSLSISVSWNESSHTDYRYDTETLANTLQLHTSLELGTTTLSFAWSRPLGLRSSGWRGSETMTYTLDWSQRVGSTGVSFAGLVKQKRSFPNGEFSSDYEAEAVLDFETLSWSEWQMSPDVTLSYEGDGSESTITGRTSIRVTDGTTTIRPTVTLTAENPSTYMRKQEYKVSVSASTTAWEFLSPSLTYTGTRKVSTYRSVETIATTNHSISLRLLWIPDATERNTLTFAVRVRDDDETTRWTIDATNAYQLDITSRLLDTSEDSEDARQALAESLYPTFFLGVDSSFSASIESGETDLELTTTGRLSSALSSEWGGTLSTSVVLGSDASSGFYWALVFQLTVYIEF